MDGEIECSCELIGVISCDGAISGQISGASEITGVVSGESTLTGEVQIYSASAPPDYHGAYEVTPTEETQTLETRGKCMTDNVIVNPIPNNYGLITWNGSVLTVS